MQDKEEKEIIEESTGDKVSINDLFKDDPEKLRKIEELQKWIKENPEIFDVPEEKSTQGQAKMRQLLEDVRRSNKFRDQLKKIASNPTQYDVEDLEKVYMKYVLFMSDLHNFRKQFLDNSDTYNLKLSLCRKYGIRATLFDALLRASREDRLDGWDFADQTSGDMCELEESHRESELLDIHSFHTEIIDELDNEVYPLRLKIHRFASQRDIVDFIERNWSEISSYLEEKRIKQRSIPREVVDFIWKNKEEGPKKIESMLREKYPKSGLMYYEVTKIIAQERGRRNV